MIYKNSVHAVFFNCADVPASEEALPVLKFSDSAQPKTSASQVQCLVTLAKMDDLWQVIVEIRPIPTPENWRNWVDVIFYLTKNAQGDYYVNDHTLRSSEGQRVSNLTFVPGKGRLTWNLEVNYPERPDMDMFSFIDIESNLAVGTLPPRKDILAFDLTFDTSSHQVLETRVFERSTSPNGKVIYERELICQVYAGA